MLQQSSATSAYRVFISYAHEDQVFRDELDKHLSNLRRQQIISSWYDGDIVPGNEWKSQTKERLKTAQIILLLISADFIHSDFCYSIEMKQAIERHDAGEASVIPILLRATDWKGAPFDKLKMLPTDAQPITHWADRDAALLDVTNGIRKAVEELNSQRSRRQSSSLPTVDSTPGITTTQSSLWNVPYRRNPFFTGRENLLKQLHDTLTANKTAALTQPYAISGLGGIGKTQAAIEYAYRYSTNYQTVLWARATTRDTLISDFVTLAELLSLDKKDVQDQNVVVAAVKGWLVNHLNWLLILDDIDDLDMIHDFLPLKVTGHVLLTTRQHSVREIAIRIEVEKMDTDEGVLLLLRRSGLLAANGLLNEAIEADRAKAEAIVEIVDGLPLALNQAGAYIDETGCGLSEYLNLYQTRFRELIGLPNTLPYDYRETVATTWSLSFQKVEQMNRAAAALLRLCAFLAVYTIPEEIITKGAAHLGKLLGPVAADAFKLNEAMEVVQRYSLVRRNPETKTLTVHRLVQAVFKDRMNAKTQRLWAMRAIQAVNAAFPEVRYETWSDCQRYLLLAQVCADLVEEYRLISPEAARLLTHAGWYLRERALYAQAEPLLKSALSIREQVLGPQHPDTATSCNNLAQLYRLQGEYEQAEPLCQRALSTREQVLGPQHPDTAFTLHDLGHLYYFQGELKKAEPFYQRALSIREQVLGPQHPHTATTLNHLGMLYHSQGRYEKAEVFYKRALEIREQILGPEDPLIATALNGIALLYYAQGKYERAEAHYKRALKIREQVLGSEHHHTTITLNHLGLLYQDQGEYNKAELLHQRVLTIREQALGSQHPDIGFTLNDLAHLYHLQGRHAQAEVMYKRALTIKEQKIGLQHPGTATTLNNLARLYQDQGHYDQAEVLYQRALAIRTQTLSPEHPHTITTLNDLSHLYRLQGRYVSAEPLYQFVLTVRERVLGPDHPHTATTLSDLARLYQEQGRYDQAESHYKRALAIITRVLNSDHPHTTTTLGKLASLYQEQDRYALAEPIFDRVLAMKERVLGPDHPSTATTLNDLARLYQEQGRYTQAEELFDRALVIKERVLGPDHPSTATTLNDLASLYYVQRKYGQAERLYRRVLPIRENVLGLDHQDTAATLHNMAMLSQRQEKYEEAEELFNRALGIYERVLGPDHPDIDVIIKSYMDFHRNKTRDEKAT